MRFTLLLLALCCLPLWAGDLTTLEKAVKSFASDELAERQAATRSVREYMARELAPLLQAMDSKDPEVSRRAREAIAGLLPDRDEAPSAAIPAFGGNMIQIINIAGGGKFRVLRGGNVVIQGVGQNVRNVRQKQVKRIKQFGFAGYPVTQPLLRNQLGLAAGRGYAVSKVEPRTQAAKLGLATHDVIVAIDGKPVMDQKSVFDALGLAATWTGKTIRILRHGQVRELKP